MSMRSGRTIPCFVIIYGLRLVIGRQHNLNQRNFKAASKKYAMRSKSLIAFVVIGIFILALMLWSHSPSSADPIAASSPASPTTLATHNPGTYQAPSNAPVVSAVSKKVGCNLSWCKRLSGKSIRQFVEGLTDAANHGDAQAALEIYRAESFCARVPRIQQNMREMSAANGPELFASYQSSVDAIQTVCADFNGNERERLNYLLIAVKAGVPNAAEYFAFEPPEGVDHFHTERIDPNDPRVIQWQTDAIEYLTQAAMHGDTGAMGLLSGFYANGQMTTQNLQMALTYTIALAQIGDEKVDNPTIAELSGKLTSRQVSAARAAANQLVNSCCARR